MPCVLAVGWQVGIWRVYVYVAREFDCHGFGLGSSISVIEALKELKYKSVSYDPCT